VHFQIVHVSASQEWFSNSPGLCQPGARDSFHVEKPLVRDGFRLLQFESRCKPVLALAAIVPLNALQGAINFY
jgi:hypothetical protein